MNQQGVYELVYPGQPLPRDRDITIIIPDTSPGGALPPNRTMPPVEFKPYCLRSGLSMDDILNSGIDYVASHLLEDNEELVVFSPKFPWKRITVLIHWPGYKPYEAKLDLKEVKGGARTYSARGPSQRALLRASLLSSITEIYMQFFKKAVVDSAHPAPEYAFSLPQNAQRFHSRNLVPIRFKHRKDDVFQVDVSLHQRSMTMA
ncbi:hypothetical protein C8Q79DRAFT_930180 [Trametes meyenii]|nr:hypothetical protein C8Q79DRAFT_930180 [Trametes meyenii]